jgi:nitrite reductase (NADH) small subunit
MTTLTATCVPLCVLDDLPLGLGRSFVVGGVDGVTDPVHIAVFRNRSGKVFAVEGVCPHKGGPLADGMLAGDDTVVCPLHSFRFEAGNGRCDQAEVCELVTYPVEVRNGVVAVTV